MVRKGDKRMKKIGRMLIFFIAVAMGMLSFGNAGMGKVSAYGVGDYVYLDVTSYPDWWTSEEDKILLCGNYDKPIKLEKTDVKYLYKAKITSIGSAGNIIFIWTNKTNYNWNDWGWDYRTNDKFQTVNISLGDSSTLFKGSQSNTYVLTGRSGEKLTGEWRIIEGKTLYFRNMNPNDSLDTVTAYFKGSDGTESGVTMTSNVDGVSGLYSATIPNGKTSQVTFKKQSDSSELETVSISDGKFNPEGNNTYYYQSTNEGSNKISVWGSKIDSAADLSGKKLYFSSSDFPTSGETPKIALGTDTAVSVSKDETA